jgi:glycosyltransferase involved in cell wall biosynthesis
MRVILCTDAPHATSGYSVAAGMIGPMLRDLGHDFAYLAAFGHHGAMGEFQGLPVYPGGLDGFGNDVIAAAARDWRADVVITLKDLWVYRPQEWGPGLRWVPLLPVDHDPIPEGIVHMLRQHCYHPIAYSRFGEAQLLQAGFAPSYAPHTFDPAVLAPMDKAEARAKLNIPADVFAIGMVAVNRGGFPSRKAWPQNIEGFARFARVNPRARLFCHTHVGETGREGAVNLPALCQQLGIIDRVSFVDQQAYDRGLPADYLRTFYAAMDVLNCASVGEGYGIPTLEAQALGTPVVVGDWTSSAELLFAGVGIPKEEAFAFYDAQGSYIFLPEPRAIAAAFDTMAQRLANPQEAQRLRALALAGAAPYARDAVRDTHWKPTMERIEHLIRTEPARGVLRIVRPESVLVSTEGAAWAQEAVK